MGAEWDDPIEAIPDPLGSDGGHWSVVVVDRTVGFAAGVEVDNFRELMRDEALLVGKEAFFPSFVTNDVSFFADVVSVVEVVLFLGFLRRFFFLGLFVGFLL